MWIMDCYVNKPIRLTQPPISSGMEYENWVVCCEMTQFAVAATNHGHSVKMK